MKREREGGKERKREKGERERVKREKGVEAGTESSESGENYSAKTELRWACDVFASP